MLISKKIYCEFALNFQSFQRILSTLFVHPISCQKQLKTAIAVENSIAIAVFINTFCPITLISFLLIYRTLIFEKELNVFLLGLFIIQLFHGCKASFSDVFKTKDPQRKDNEYPVIYTQVFVCNLYNPHETHCRYAVGN